MEACREQFKFATYKLVWSDYYLFTKTDILNPVRIFILYLNLHRLSLSYKRRDSYWTKYLLLLETVTYPTNRLMLSEVMFFPPKIFSQIFLLIIRSSSNTFSFAYLYKFRDGQLNGNTSLLKIDLFFLIIFCSHLKWSRDPTTPKTTVKGGVQRENKKISFPK